jgi:hypothetical protein
VVSIFFQALGALLRYLRIGSASGRQHNSRLASTSRQLQNAGGCRTKRGSPPVARHWHFFCLFFVSNPSCNFTVACTAKLVFTSWNPEQSLYFWKTCRRVRCWALRFPNLMSGEGTRAFESRQKQWQARKEWLIRCLRHHRIPMTQNPVVLLVS